jgi:hypothetical protein
MSKDKDKKPSIDELAKISIIASFKESGRDPWLIEKVLLPKKINTYAVVDQKGIEIYEYKTFRKETNKIESHTWDEWTTVTVDNFFTKSVFAFTGDSGTLKLAVSNNGNALSQLIKNRSPLTLEVIPRTWWRKILGFRSNVRWKMAVASIIYFYLFIMIVGLASNDSASQPATTSVTEENNVETTAKSEDSSKNEEEKKAEAQAQQKAEGEAKKKADEEAKLEAQKQELEMKQHQQAVLDFEKSVYDLEDTIEPIMDNYQKAMTGLGNGSVDIYTAYTAAKEARDACQYLQTKFYTMPIPEGLPEEIDALLSDASSDLGTAYYTKKEAMEYVLKFLDEQKPSYMDKFKEEISMSDQFMISGIAKIFDAKVKVGIDVTKEQ